MSSKSHRKPTLTAASKNLTEMAENSLTGCRELLDQCHPLKLQPFWGLQRAVRGSPGHVSTNTTVRRVVAARDRIFSSDTSQIALSKYLALVRCPETLSRVPTSKFASQRMELLLRVRISRFRASLPSLEQSLPSLPTQKPWRKDASRRYQAFKVTKGRFE